MTVPRNISLGLFFAALAVVGLVTPGFQLLAVNQHLFLAVNVLALNFCLGLGGQISLAQAAFAGLGAYGSVLLHDRFPEATLVIVPAVVLGTGLLAAMLSRPMERLGEGFLAMATLCVSLVFTNLVLTLESVTGGSAGLMVERPSVSMVSEQAPSWKMASISPSKWPAWMRSMKSCLSM